MTKPGIEDGSRAEPGGALGVGSASTRRGVLKAGAAVGLGAVGLGGGGRWLLPAAAQEAATATAADICVLTPEQTEGPFYLPLELIRRDITEGKPGVPLQLRINVVDTTNGCAPLADAAVDLWHCDAQGYYSGVAANPGGNANPEAGAGSESGTFLRGIQPTDGDGVAGFATIYPGWYSGRTVHIHMKVHVGGTSDVLDVATPAATDAGTYQGGQVAHTGQIYFDDATSDEIFATAEAYAGRDNSQRVRNDQDGILGDYADEPGFILALTPLTEGASVDGLLGTITVGVDPSATPAPVGFGGGPPPGAPPPGNAGGPPPGAPDGTAPAGG